MITYRGLLCLFLTAMPSTTVAPSIGSQRFATYYSYDPGEISQRYSAHRTTINAALKSGKKKTDCAFLLGRLVSCIEGKYKLEPIVIPPFVPYLPDSSGGISQGWAPVTETLRGEQTLRSWRQFAASGQLFECTERGDCEIIVHTPEGLAYCSITKMRSGKLGAPKYCDPLVVKDNGVLFLSIIEGHLNLSPSEGRKDFDLIVYSQLTHQKSRIEKVLIQALASHPLSLSTELQPSGDILGVASYRTSEVLKGWREIVTIRLQTSLEAPSQYRRRRPMTEPPVDVAQFIGVEVITTVYVNRQNSTRRADWSLPTEAQETLWSLALRANLKHSLESLCKIRNWIDDKTLECH